MVDSEIVKEIKKERLSRHFDEVDRVIRLYQPALHAPPPFRVTDGEPWPRVYRPKVEQDSNANHMLRRHLRSRAFWKHHGDWERELEAIRGGGEGLLQDIAAVYLAGLMEENNEIRPTRLFGRTALEDAFQEHDNMKVAGRYELRQEGGVNYRGHLIAEAATQENFESVKTAHWHLVDKMKSSPEMSVIGSLWETVKSHQISMGKILNDVVLAGDLIYPCRFCRSFFRD